MFYIPLLEGIGELLEVLIMAWWMLCWRIILYCAWGGVGFVEVCGDGVGGGGGWGSRAGSCSFCG